MWLKFLFCHLSLFSLSVSHSRRGPRAVRGGNALSHLSLLSLLSRLLSPRLSLCVRCVASVAPHMRAHACAASVTRHVCAQCVCCVQFLLTRRKSFIREREKRERERVTKNTMYLVQGTLFWRVCVGWCVFFMHLTIL